MDLLCSDEHLDNLPEVSSPPSILAQPITSFIVAIIPTHTQTAQPASALLAQERDCGLQRMLGLSASFFRQA